MSINNLSSQTLAHFTDTEKYTWGPFRKFVMTDGCTYLCENGCGWLLDLIASHQTVALRKKANGAQFWRLEQLDSKDYMARAVCDDGNGNIIIEQKIEFTDFPFDRFPNGITIYVKDGHVPSVGNCLVALLPSEY